MPTANQVFRDYVTDGVPASGANPVSKSEARAWGSGLEATIASPVADGGITTAKLADASVTQAKISTKVFALPSAPASDLRTWLQARHGDAWTQRTGVGTGTDIGLAMADWADAVAGYGKLIIPAGLWLMKTPLSSARMKGKMIEGLHSQASKIVFDADVSMFSFTGEGGFSGGGIKGLGVLLEDSRPTSNAIFASLQGDATYQADQMAFEDCYVSAIGSSYWVRHWNQMATARTSPQGSRVGTCKNMQFFRSRDYPILIWNAVQWSWDNVGTYVGTGALANNIYIGGGGTSSTNSIQLYMRAMACGGELNITNVTDFEVRGKCGSLATAATADFGEGWLNVVGATSGTFGTNTNITQR